MHSPRSEVGRALDWVAEYLELRTRERRLGRDLDPESRRRLAALEQQLSAAPARRAGEPADRRRFSRHVLREEATLSPPAGPAQSVVIEDIGGGGLRVRPAPYLKLGDLARLSVVSRSSGRRYEFSVRPQWLYRSRGASAMGLFFLG